MEVSVSYENDQITKTTSNICGSYKIIAAFNSAASTIVTGTIDPTLTVLVGKNATNLKFNSNQTDLSGLLQYDIQIVSDAFVSPSPIATWTLSLRNCDKKYGDWIDTRAPI